MKHTNQRQFGSITMEYVIVTLLLMLPIWYAFVGGSGSWSDTERDANTGNLTIPIDKASDHPPALVRTLNKRQKDFVHELYQP